MHFYKRRSVVGRIYIKRDIMNQKGEKSRRGWNSYNYIARVSSEKGTMGNFLRIWCSGSGVVIILSGISGKN